MNEALISGIISLIGTIIGTFAGILTSAKLTVYRIGQLEKRVEKHNSVIERTFVLEGQMKEVQHEIRDLKEEEQKK